MAPPRRFTRAFLELRPCDYEQLRIAAIRTLRRLGRSSREYPVEDLVSIGWQRTFFYFRSYELFARLGSVQAGQEMARYIREEDRRRRRFRSLPENYQELYGESNDEHRHDTAASDAERPIGTGAPDAGPDGAVCPGTCSACEVCLLTLRARGLHDARPGQGDADE